MTEKATDMDTGDLRSRMVKAEHDIQANSQRLTVLEAWQRQGEITEVQRQAQFKSMDERFGRIEADLTQINGTLAKIMWLVIGGIIMAMVAFLVRGGFSP